MSFFTSKKVKGLFRTSGQASISKGWSGRGQGTIEYLVIIAIVVVIALVMTALIFGFTSNDSTSINSAKLRQQTGPISVSEAVVD